MQQVTHKRQRINFAEFYVMSHNTESPDSPCVVHFQQTKTMTIFALGEYRDDGRWSGVGENAREVFEDVVLSLTQVIGKV